MCACAWEGGVKIRPFRYGNIEEIEEEKKNVKIVKIRPFRYGNIRNVEIYRSLKG